jgi:hypothetical protein
VCESTGEGDFAEETVLLVSALGLWGENAWANGGESGSSGAGGVKKRGAIGSLADGGAKARGRGGVCREDAAGAIGTGETGVGKARRKAETAYRSAV